VSTTRRIARRCLCALALTIASAAFAEEATLEGEIELRDALAAALRASPELEQVASETRAREAAALQAGALPNPELALEVEDVAGSGERRGVESAQTTLSLAQLVELGGKRAQRVRVADLDTQLAGRDADVRRVAVLCDTAKAFIAVLALQERRALADELSRLAADMLRSVASTVRAGAVSPVEEERARVNLERVQLDLLRIDKQLGAARALLAASWGEAPARFERVRGELAQLPPLPPIERLDAAVAEGPELARWHAEVARREALVALERARRVPDVTLELGARHYADGADAGLVAGLRVPLPLFDRNRGRQLEAGHELASARSAQRAADLTLRASLEAVVRELEIAHGEVTALRDRILPSAERVFRETRRGYARGLFRHVEVLDAQRTLFDARRELLDAYAAFYLAAVDLERLTGTPLTELAGGSTP
jgi:outer membrane protein, heavy metal efflux system